MRWAAVLVGAGLVSGCGLRTGGKRLPDGGTIGTMEGCNRTVADGNRVVDPVDAPFANVNALSFDGSGKLYVLNRTSSQSWISVFSAWPNNDAEKVLGRGVLTDGVDLALDSDGTFWVLQDEGRAGQNGKVVHLSAAGALLSSFEVTLTDPGGLVVAPDGTLYVAATFITQYDRAGQALQQMGKKEPLIPHYQGMRVDSRGQLWATEINERTVEQFNASGDRLAKFGGHGSGPGMFDGNTEVHGGPTDLAFDRQGDLYANDPLGSRIMKFNRQGTMLGAFSFGGPENVEPIAVDPQSGAVYVGRDNGVDILCPL